MSVPADRQLSRAAPATRAVLLLAAFVLVYVLHVAIETGVGGWEPTHLQALGHTAAAAATATSVFWLMLTVGRFAVAPISLRWPPSMIVTWSCVAMAAFLGLATVPALAPYAYAGVGLAIAPIFPTGLAWLNRAVPSAAKAGAYVIAASMIGGVAFPPLLGGVIDRAGVSRLPLVLLLLAAICAGASWWLTGRTRGRGEGRAG